MLPNHIRRIRSLRVHPTRHAGPGSGPQIQFGILCRSEPPFAQLTHSPGMQTIYTGNGPVTRTKISGENDEGPQASGWWCRRSPCSSPTEVLNRDDLGD